MVVSFSNCSSECSYALSWTGKVLRPLVDSHHSFALHGCKTSGFQLLGDGALVSLGFLSVRLRSSQCASDTCGRNHSLSPHVPYFVPHCKVLCQDQAPHTLQILTQVVGRMLPSRCRSVRVEVPRPHHFLNVSHWARLRPLPRRGLDLG